MTMTMKIMHNRDDVDNDLEGLQVWSVIMLMFMIMVMILGMSMIILNIPIIMMMMMMSLMIMMLLTIILMICSGRAPCPVCDDGGGLLPASMDSDKTDTDMLMVMEVITMMMSTKQIQLVQSYYRL